MITFILVFLRKINPLTYICIALCIATLYGFHTFKTRYIEQGKALIYQEWKIADLKRKEQENSDRIAEQQHQAAINQQVKRELENEINQIHTSYANVKRLRLSKSACVQSDSVTTAAGSSIANEATTGTIALPEPIERNLYELMHEADSMLADYRALQEFIKKNNLTPQF